MISAADLQTTPGPGAPSPEPRDASGVRPLPEEPLPRIFERLLLLKHLARGGMGDVFLAASGAIEGAERPCVVKTIRPDHIDDESFLARFLDETRVQSQLLHPSVGQILEAATDRQGKPYAVVEYIEGRNLADVRVQAGQLGTVINWTEAVAIAAGIAEGLATMHECQDASGRSLQMAHRDLSPQNVMVGYAGDVKLIDFGTARGENRRCRTVAGVVFAKPGYVAPEVANNTPGGPAADIYSLGVMLWELIAGRRFLYGDPASHLAAVAQGTRCPAALARTAGVPGELDRIIARLTATRIEQRYPTAREARTDLLRLLEQAEVESEGASPVQRIRRLMTHLFPSEPARSRAEFVTLLAHARAVCPPSSVQGERVGRPAADTGLLAGTRYRLTKELGRGSSAVVYEATHVDLERVFALKVLSRHAGQDDDADARLRSEARILAQIDHPNLVKIHDFGFAQDGRPFFVMERLFGRTLADCLAEAGPMGFQEVVPLAIQACSALSEAHQRGLYHRDVSLQNLFVTDDGVIKLLDFGLAGGLKQRSLGDGALRVAGTPETVSPEQARGEAGDARSDIYALAAVLYQLLCDRPTHEAESLVALLKAKSTSDPALLATRGARRVPRSLQDVIFRALERHPELRYQSAAAFAAGLETALRAHRRVKRRRRVLLGALVGIALAGAIVGAWSEWSKEPVQPLVAWLSAAKNQLQRFTGRGAQPEVSQGERLAVLSSFGARPDEGLAPTPVDQEAPLGALPTAAEERKAELVGHDTAMGDEGLAVEPPAEAQPLVAEPALPAESSQAPPELIDAMHRIERLAERGNVVTALSRARDLARANPDRAEARKLLVDMAVRAKAWGEALKAARAWDEAHRSPEARTVLLHLLQRTGQKAEAARLEASQAREEG